jgi:hypothetical protein
MRTASDAPRAHLRDWKGPGWGFALDTFIGLTTLVPVPAPPRKSGCSDAGSFVKWLATSSIELEAVDIVIDIM